MAKKQQGKNWDLKAAKDLFNDYIEKGSEKREIPLPEDTVKIDDLNRKHTLERVYNLIDDIIERIYNTGKPSILLPSRSSSNIIWDEDNDLLLLGKQIIEKQFHSLIYL